MQALEDAYAERYQTNDLREIVSALSLFLGWRDLPGQLRKRSPLGYNGSPAEIASLVSYLASKESHFITGEARNVNPILSSCIFRSNGGSC